MAATTAVVVIGHGDIGSDEMGLSVNWPMEGTNHESYHSWAVQRWAELGV